MFSLRADQKFTVEEAVETIGFGRFHILLFVIMGATSVSLVVQQSGPLVGAFSVI